MAAYVGSQLWFQLSIWELKEEDLRSRQAQATQWIPLC